MNDRDRKRLLEMIERFTEEDTRSPEIAFATLVREGIYLANGDLAPEFGGPKQATGEE